MAHSSKSTCFKFYILLQGLDGVQVPVRRVLARTDYQAPTCAEWVPISLLSNSLLQMTRHQRLEGYLSPARTGVCGVLLGRSGLTRSLQTTSPSFNLQGLFTSVKRYRLREEISTSPGPLLDAQKIFPGLQLSKYKSSSNVEYENTFISTNLLCLDYRFVVVFRLLQIQMWNKSFPTADRPGQLLTSSRHRGLGGWLGAGRTISFGGEFSFYFFKLCKHFATGKNERTLFF